MAPSIRDSIVEVKGWKKRKSLFTGKGTKMFSGQRKFNTGVETMRK